MKKNSIYADISGIHIPQPSGSQYTITWDNIRRTGYDWWIRHLSDKCWFTEELRNSFFNLVSKSKYIKAV